MKSPSSLSRSHRPVFPFHYVKSRLGQITGMVSVALPCALATQASSSFPEDLVVMLVLVESFCVVSGLSFAMDWVLDGSRDHGAMFPIHPPLLPVVSNALGTADLVVDHRFEGPTRLLCRALQSPRPLCMGSKENITSLRASVPD